MDSIWDGRTLLPPRDEQTAPVYLEGGWDEPFTRYQIAHARRREILHVRARRRARYATLKAEGRCVRCGEPVTERTYCRPCFTRWHGRNR